MSEIVTKRNQILTLNLHNGNGRGNLGILTVHAEESVAFRTAVEMTLRCLDLDNKDLFSKSDPFLRISTVAENGRFVPICKTEVMKNSLSPIFKPICLSMQQFGSKENPLVIECFNFDSSGNHQLIGKLHKSVAELETLHQIKSGANFSFPPTGIHRHERVLKGRIFVETFIEKQLYSFLDSENGIYL